MRGCDNRKLRPPYLAIASISDTPYFAPSVDDAVRHTMMMVLRSLKTTRTLRQQPVMAMAR